MQFIVWLRPFKTRLKYNTSRKFYISWLINKLTPSFLQKIQMSPQIIKENLYPSYRIPILEALLPKKCQLVNATTSISPRNESHKDLVPPLSSESPTILPRFQHKLWPNLLTINVSTITIGQAQSESQRVCNMQANWQIWQARR